MRPVRIVSSVGLEHYFDRVGVTGSNPVQSTDTAADEVAVFLCNGLKMRGLWVVLGIGKTGRREVGNGGVVPGINILGHEWVTFLTSAFYPICKDELSTIYLLSINSNSHCGCCEPIKKINRLNNFHTLHKMTPKQTERLQKKIADIKRILAAEKRKFGCYDDSRGLRYMPLRYFIQLDDYSGGLNYIKWFNRHFPDDSGFPEFLFECTIVLAKTGRFKDAESKAFETFCSNPYLIDQFFGRPIQRLDIWHGSNLALPEYAETLPYSAQQLHLRDFAEWLGGVIAEEPFISRSRRYIDIQKLLVDERELDKRRRLSDEAYILKWGRSRHEED